MGQKFDSYLLWCDGRVFAPIGKRQIFIHVDVFFRAYVLSDWVTKIFEIIDLVDEKSPIIFFFVQSI